ncbi:hypothetical protein FKM82_008821 [Ascaphus truei]
MWVMQCQLHLGLMIGATVFFPSQVQTNTDFWNTNNTLSTMETNWNKTDEKNTTRPAPNHVGNRLGNNLNRNLDLHTHFPKMFTSTTEETPLPANITNGYTDTMHTIPNKQCNSNTDKYKTGLVICIIIIASLVLVCVILIIAAVALANRVSSLKAKLTQSKRQARSNGDFLSASSIIWPQGLETWQKKSQLPSIAMDEISLGNTVQEENNQLMLTPMDENSKHCTEEKNKAENAHSLETNFFVEI